MEKTRRHLEADRDEKSGVALEELKCYCRYKIGELLAEHGFHVHRILKHVASRLLYREYWDQIHASTTRIQCCRMSNPLNCLSIASPCSYRGGPMLLESSLL